MTTATPADKPYFTMDSLDQFVESGPKYDNGWLVASQVSGTITSLKKVRDFWVVGIHLDHLPPGAEVADGYTTMGSNAIRDAKFEGALLHDMLPLHFERLTAVQGKGPQPFYEFV